MPRSSWRMASLLPGCSRATTTRMVPCPLSPDDPPCLFDDADPGNIRVVKTPRPQVTKPEVCHRGVSDEYAGLQDRGDLTPGAGHLHDARHDKPHHGKRRV